MDLLKQILQQHRKNLLQLPNVVGVGVGKKRLRGREADEPAIIVFVEKKLPPDFLPRAGLVPETVEKVKTDVVETGRFRLLTKNTGRFRPAQPGVSIGHYRITAGTFGAVVYDRRSGKPLILSNNHILANRTNGADGRARPGDPILQPGPYDGGNPERDVIASLERFVPLRYKEEPVTCPVAAGLEWYMNSLIKAYRPHYTLRLFREGTTYNLVDCAVAQPTDEGMIMPEILKIGPVKGTVEAEAGRKVKKCGRTTDLTTGTIQYTNVTATVDVGENQQAYFEDQFITSALSKPGDSGSLVLDEGNRAVGLLFAGSYDYTVCNRIQNVLTALNVRF